MSSQQLVIYSQKMTYTVACCW